MLSSEEAIELLDSFPPVEFAFAYGSGVVEQGGYKYEHTDPSKLPMLDIILVVENSEKWHTENMKCNESHYSSLVPLSSRYVAQFQEQIPAHLWFNAYVPMQSKQNAGRMMKYGVISKKHLLDDLTKWSNLYTAGRLQKPVRILKNNEIIENAIKSNLESAVRTSLLMLPEQFEEIDLYLSIASLSYVGDPRMYLGENPKKVCCMQCCQPTISYMTFCCFVYVVNEQVLNLVMPIVPHYKSLYRGALESLTESANLVKVPATTTSPGGTSSSGSVGPVVSGSAVTGSPFVYKQVTCLRFTVHFSTMRTMVHWNQLHAT